MNRRGFTMVELMIVVAISGTVAAAGGAFYLEHRVGAARIEAQVNLQRNASLALEIVARDLRGARAVATEDGIVVVHTSEGQTIRYALDDGKLARAVNGGEPWVLLRFVRAFGVEDWSDGSGWVAHLVVGRELLEGRKIVLERSVIARRTVR